jgi:hypothetical protein
MLSRIENSSRRSNNFTRPPHGRFSLVAEN